MYISKYIIYNLECINILCNVILECISRLKIENCVPEYYSEYKLYFSTIKKYKI